MAEQERQGLDLGGLDLDEFKPRKQTSEEKPTKEDVAAVTNFPSREASADDQLNIHGSKAILNRFRDLRKSERYKYSDLLEFMMDAYEEKRGIR